MNFGYCTLTTLAGSISFQDYKWVKASIFVFT